MNFRIRNLMQFVPKWKLVLYLVAILILTIVTSYMITLSTRDYIANSITLSGLHQEIIYLIGKRKYLNFIFNYGALLYFLFNCLIFIVYLSLLYFYLKNFVYRQMTRMMIDRVGFIAEGNFDHPLETSDIPEFAALANHVNGIVAKLQQSLEEERLAEQAKKDLITNVSHDLRTPLTSITGFLGLIE